MNIEGKAHTQEIKVDVLNMKFYFIHDTFKLQFVLSI